MILHVLAMSAILGAIQPGSGGAEISQIEVRLSPFDQAIQSLTRLHQSGTYDSILVGWPTDDQRATVLQECADVVRLLEAIPVESRDVRTNLMLGVHTTMIAVALEGEERVHHLTRAAQALDAAESSSIGFEAVRINMTGHGHRLLGRADEAVEAYTFILEELASTGDADQSTWIQAQIGTATYAPDPIRQLDQYSRESPARFDGITRPRLALLLVDASSRLLLEHWRKSSDVAALRDAIRRQASTLDRQDLGLTDDQRRTIVHENVGRLVATVMNSNEAPSLQELGPLASLSFAVRQARNGGRGEAMEILRSASGADSQAWGHEIAWELAVLLSQGSVPEQVEAVRLLTQLGADPAWDRRAAALEGALSYGRQVAGFDLSSNDAYLRALRLATGADLPVADVDSWRLELAGMLLREDPDRAQLRDGLGVLDAVDSTGPHADRAAAMYVGQVRVWLDHAAARLSDLRRDGRVADGARVASEALGVALEAAAWATNRNRPERRGFETDVVDFSAETNRLAGLDLGLSLIGEAESPASMPRQRAIEGWPERVWLSVARLEMLDGRDEAAFGRLRALTSYLDSLGFHPETYWHAWALLLELLRAQDPDGMQGGRIGAQIKRLELIDGKLGGSPWAERIRAAGAAR